MPADPPIQHLDRIDLMGRRHDGSLDLLIVVTGALDGSAETRELLRKKVAAYVQAVGSPAFRDEFGDPSPERTTIAVRCDGEVDPAALDFLGWLRPWVEMGNARLELRHQDRPVALPEP